MKFLDDLRAYLERPEPPPQSFVPDVPSEKSRIDQYALAVRAVRRVDGGRAITPIGKLILELRDRDALRWMLAVEVLESRGVDDRWRLSKEGATKLLKNPEGYRDYGEGDPPPWPIQGDVFYRLSQMGLVKLTSHAEDDVISYELLRESQPLLEEIASDNDTPFILLARAMLQDETAALFGQSPAGALLRQENAASTAILHARMVAHEIHNSLVPMKVMVKALYREIERRGLNDVLAGDRERIDMTIARIFSFVQDLGGIANLAVAPAKLFDLVPAIETAIASVGPEVGRAVAFHQEAEFAPVMGSRERFILALANVLRNASQGREEPPVQIQVTVGARNGAEVFVRVDDDGPGVAEADRTSIFSPGFSRRPGGSGQGLAFVREVVEAEMAGRVIYEESPLGGARFVIRLPVGTKRST